MLIDRYMAPEALSKCVRQAKQQGWNGGVMYWEWNSVSRCPIGMVEILTR